MKATVMLGLMALSTSAHGQGQLCDLLPMYNDRVHYEAWVEEDTAAKANLYTRGKEWLLGAGNIAVDTLRYQNERHAMLVGDGTLHIPGEAVRVSYTFTITAIDGRYQYSIADFYAHEHSGRLPLVPWLRRSPPDTSGAVCHAIDEHVQGLAGALTAFMRLPPR